MNCMKSGCRKTFVETNNFILTPKGVLTYCSEKHMRDYYDDEDGSHENKLMDVTKKLEAGR